MALSVRRDVLRGLEPAVPRPRLPGAPRGGTGSHARRTRANEPHRDRGDARDAATAVGRARRGELADIGHTGGAASERKRTRRLFFLTRARSLAEWTLRGERAKTRHFRDGPVVQRPSIRPCQGRDRRFESGRDRTTPSISLSA